MRFCLALLAALAVALPARAEELSPLGLAQVVTADARIIYFDPTLTYLAPYAVATFTNSMAWQRRVLGWQPWERTTVLLKDFSDYGNAGASPLPRNMLRLDIAPVSYAFETYSASERMYSIMNHELTHVSTMDYWSAEDSAWRHFFGGKVMPEAPNPETLVYSYLTTPRFTVPRWYAEGSAVFMETWMGGGIGRAQGGFDEMVFRAKVRDGGAFYDPLGLESRGTRVDFQGGANAYLYGTRFFTWLALAHGPGKVVAWLKRDAGSKRHYADQFEHVFGMPLEKAWQDWVTFEGAFQRENLEQVRKFPITPHRDLVAAAVGSASRAFYDETKGEIYAAFSYPGVVAHVGALSTKDGAVRRLADLKGTLLYKVTSLAYDPATRTAFFVNDNTALRDLYSLNVDTGEEKLLLEDARIGEIAFNPADRSLLGVRHQFGLATLVRIPYPYTEWNQVHTFDYGVVPYDLDISADGKLLAASVSVVNGDQFLRVWTLDKVLAGNLQPLNEFRFGQSVPESFVFTPDGRYLYGSSYYTGVSNIFRYEVATGEVEAVSNAEAGFFRPMPLADGRLVIFHYTEAGFVPATIEPRVLKDVSAIQFLGAAVAAKHPVVKTWQVPPPSTVDPATVIVSQGPYVPLANVAFQSAYPVLQGYKEYGGVGYHFRFDDPLSLVAIGVTAAYTPSQSLSKDDRAHFEATYRYLGWHADLSWNRSDFYDLFGPTIRSRRGLAVKGGYDQMLIYDEPRKLELKTEAAFYNRLDALPDSQNVVATSPRLATLEAGLYYTNARRSRGAVDDEKGITADLVGAVSFADGKTFPQLRGKLDFGFALPFAHGSLWLRNAAGVSGGDRESPYANFYFGGFGNNYVDSRNEKRYREHYAFPGFDIDELGGRSFSRNMAELNLPPVVFESVGTPVFHLAWLRPAVFASVLWTDPASSERRSRNQSVGLQFDLRFSVLHWYEMTLSAGYAAGYRGGTRAGDEWMVSLKIM
jgi:hypothetical protein